MHGIIKVTKWRGLNTYTGLPQSKPQVLMLTPCLNELGPEQPWPEMRVEASWWPDVELQDAPPERQAGKEAHALSPADQMRTHKHLDLLAHSS